MPKIPANPVNPAGSPVSAGSSRAREIRPAPPSWDLVQYFVAARQDTGLAAPSAPLPPSPQDCERTSVIQSTAHASEMAAWGVTQSAMASMSARRALIKFYDNALYFVDLGCSTTDIANVSKLAFPEGAMAVARDVLPDLLGHGVSEASVLSLVARRDGGTRLRSLASHLPALLNLRFDPEQVVSAVRNNPVIPLKSIVMFSQRLIDHGASHQEICELASGVRGATVLKAIHDCLPRLSQIGMSFREVADLVRTSGAGEAAATAFRYLDQLTEFGVPVKCAIALARQPCAASHLPVVIREFKQLRAWTFSNEDIGGLAGELASLAALEETVLGIKRLHVLNFSQEDIRALARRADAPLVIGALSKYAAILLGNGFAPNDILRIARGESGGETLHAIASLPWKGLCGQDELLQLASTPQAARAIQWFCDNHARLRAFMNVPAIVAAAIRWSEGVYAELPLAQDTVAASAQGDGDAPSVQSARPRQTEPGPASSATFFRG